MKFNLMVAILFLIVSTVNRLVMSKDEREYKRQILRNELDRSEGSFIINLVAEEVLKSKLFLFALKLFISSVPILNVILLIMSIGRMIDEFAQ